MQAGLEESVHGSQLRRLLTEAYEASAGLSDNESPSVRGPPIAPDAPRLRTELFEASAGLSQNESPRVRGPPVDARRPAHALSADPISEVIAVHTRTTRQRGLSLANYAPPG